MKPKKPAKATTSARKIKEHINRVVAQQSPVTETQTSEPCNLTYTDPDTGCVYKAHVVASGTCTKTPSLVAFEKWWNSLPEGENGLRAVKPGLLLWRQDVEPIWIAARIGTEAKPAAIDDRFQDAIEQLYTLRLQFQKCAASTEACNRVTRHHTNKELQRLNKLETEIAWGTWLQAANFVSEAIELLTRPETK